MDINSCPKIVEKFGCEDPDQPWRVARGGGGGGGGKREKGYVESRIK